jgi:GFO/IDH/MocA oxidoreductase family protein
MQNPKSSRVTAGFSRRQFIVYTSLAAGAVALPGWAAVRKTKSPNEKLNVGVIGAGGKGSSDTDNVASLGENIYALCDVDEGTLKSRAQKYPQAQLFRDYREMLEKIGKNLDAVTVSTPDHHHAPAAVMAMKMGLHVYCQKPLTHSVYEARTLRRLAKEKKVATQMGNQGSAGSGLRRAVEVIQAGLIGNPLQLHVWSNRPIWPQGIDRPAGEDSVPSNLDWDLWIGPAPMRPFKNKVYHPFAWRGWRDFGTGALGDMACHTVNMPFRALKLGYPNVVECEETSELHPETYPKTSRIRFEFPAREGLPPVKFWWYDGSPADKSVKLLRPHPDLTKEILDWAETQKDRSGNPRPRELPASGCLIIGSKGKVFSPDDYGSQFFFSLTGDKAFQAARTRDSEHEAIRHIPQSIPRLSGDGDRSQKEEWIKAIRGGPPAYSNFDIAAYLTEIILLGCVAMRVGVGKRLDWDGPKMRAKNTREADQFVRRHYRKGWTV